MKTQSEKKAMKNLRDLAAATDAILKNNGLVENARTEMLAEAKEQSFETHPIYTEYFKGGKKENPDEKYRKAFGPYLDRRVHSYTSKDDLHNLSHYKDKKLNVHVVNIRTPMSNDADITGYGEHKDLHTAVNMALEHHAKQHKQRVAEVKDHLKQLEDKTLHKVDHP